MFDELGDVELIDLIASAQRAEAQACARKLDAIGVLVDRHADLGKPDERDHHALDRWDRVAAEVAAAQGITHALASSQNALRPGSATPPPGSRGALRGR
ncbi:hypothetical protein [Mycobacteroides abscessus]|uniref:hypothetical protein n=1 Tax=Mycobacteroides abscessus TaxID=36809 RepID=UPI0021042D80|nr:hypothetical protein [Mycobacteroides abscessus]